MSTHGEIKREIFKSVLRRYFFENEGTLAAFAGIDQKTLNKDERIKAIIENSKDKNIAENMWEALRERVFNSFYNRIISSVVLDENGEPYKRSAEGGSSTMIPDKLIDDFMAGKQISFMGAGADDMVSISADKDDLNRLLVDVNGRGRANKSFVPKIYEEQKRLDGSEGHIVYKSQLDIEACLQRTYGTKAPSATPPKSNIFQNWANSIKKWFTGRPTDLWAPYEKFQKMQELQQAIDRAENYKKVGNELDPKNIDAALRSVGDEKWQGALRGIIADQKQKAAEEQAEKQRIEEPEHQKEFEELENDGLQDSAEEIKITEEPVSGRVPEVPKSGETKKSAEEIKPERKIAEELHLKELPPETEQEKREKEEYRIEDQEKLAQSDLRRTAIEAYRKAFFGKAIYGGGLQDDFYIAKDKHFMSVFAKGTYRDNGIPEAEDLLDHYLLKLNEFADNGRVDYDYRAKLPEMLATVYMLGKLKDGFADREKQLKLGDYKFVDFNTIAEYDQILERFDLIKKNLTTVFEKSDLPARILADPSGEISKNILNPKMSFNKIVDAKLVDQGVYEKISNKIKGLETMPDLSAVRGESAKTQSKTGPVRNI